MIVPKAPHAVQPSVRVFDPGGSKALTPGWTAQPWSAFISVNAEQRTRSKQDPARPEELTYFLRSVVQTTGSTSAVGQLMEPPLHVSRVIKRAAAWFARIFMGCMEAMSTWGATVTGGTGVAFGVPKMLTLV